MKAPWKDNSAEVSAYNEALHNARESIFEACENVAEAAEFISDYPIKEFSDSALLNAYVKAVNARAVEGDTQTLNTLMQALGKVFLPPIQLAAEHKAEKEVGYSVY